MYYKNIRAAKENRVTVDSTTSLQLCFNTPSMDSKPWIYSHKLPKQMFLRCLMFTTYCTCFLVIISFALVVSDKFVAY